MSKCFGVGWAKTGTTTLATCFNVLGFQHQGQNLGLVKDLGNGDLSRIMNLARSRETFEDWPWILLYRELDKAFPGSRFVLTTRDPATWVGSYKNMLSGQGKASNEMNLVRRTLYGLPFPDVSAAQLLERYERHNEDVMKYFRERPDDLLVVDWAQGSEWKVLCDFLGKAIPDCHFPHANKGKYT